MKPEILALLARVEQELLRPIDPPSTDPVIVAMFPSGTETDKAIKASVAKIRSDCREGMVRCIANGDTRSKEWEGLLKDSQCLGLISQNCLTEHLESSEILPDTLTALKKPTNPV